MSRIGFFAAILLLVHCIEISCAADEDSVELPSAFYEISSIILDHHLDPPTRQEMFRAGMKSLYHAANRPVPFGLGRAISELRSKEEFEKYLLTVQHDLPKFQDGETIQSRMINGLLAIVPGPVEFENKNELDVSDLLRENRYVGIGIALGQRGGYPFFVQVIPNGPTARAGGKANDRMLKIDGRDAEGMEMQEVIKILRGQEGKPVKIDVQQPGQEPRTLDIVRGPVLFATIVDDRELSDESIGYLRLESIRGNVVSELREAARRFDQKKRSALILDLRSDTAGDVRHAVMLADSFLGTAPIGAVMTSSGQRDYSSDEQQLFAGIPIVALVDERTHRQSAWLAAALQDNERAILMGSPSNPVDFVHESMAMENVNATITFPTGYYLRANGSRLRSQELMEKNSAIATVRRTFGLQPNAFKPSLIPDHVVAKRKLLEEAVHYLQERNR